MATSTGDPTTDTGASSSVYISETTFVLVNVNDGSDGGGFGASVLADGAAFGTDTFTSADIAASVVDGTYADALSAIVLVTSAAQSPDADAVALANAMIDLIGNANVMIGVTHTSTMTTTDSDGQTSVAVAFASVTALQFDTGGTSSVGAEEPDCGCDDPGQPESPPDTIIILASEDSPLNGADLDGNLSTFDIAASAFGNDTLVDVQVDAFALEDQFSSVTAAVLVLIP